MDSVTREDLKRNELEEVLGKGMHYAEDHKRMILYGVGALLGAAVVAVLRARRLGDVARVEHQRRIRSKPDLLVRRGPELPHGRRLREHPLMQFNAVAFLANILIYWTSPEVYPRYLLMLNPLLFSIFLYLHPLHEAGRTWQYKTIQIFLLSFCIGIAGLSFLPLFLERTQDVPYLMLKALPLVMALLLLTYWMFRQPDRRLLLTVLVLLVFRIGFNWFVLPDRHDEDFGTRCRSTTIEAGKLFPDRTMYVYEDIDMQPTTSFYLTNARGKIIPIVHEMTDPSALYVINPGETPWVDYRKVGAFLVRHGKRTYDIGELPYPKTPDDK